MSVDELEATLQAAWDDDTAAVYADRLTADGDPRGELIAIDLHPNREQLTERKRELIRSWLGDAIATWTVNLHNVEYGLVRGFGAATSKDFTIVEYLEHLHAAAGPYVRDLSLYGSNADLKEALATIARLGMPWLRRLTLHRSDGTRAIDRLTWEPFAAATPHLAELTINGKAVVASPIHPTIHAMAISNLAVVVGRRPFEHVTRLDFQFADQIAFRERPAMAKLAALVNPRAFPALRILDISRNVPSPYDPPPRPIALDFLAAVEDLDRFERIRIPQLTAEHAPALLEILTEHPRLVIELARLYASIEVSHPRLILPVPRVWPAHPHGRDALTVDVPGGIYDTELALSSLVRDLEAQFDGMTAEAQAAWIAFWQFLDELGWEDEGGNTIYMQMPAAILRVALPALHGNHRVDNVLKNVLLGDPADTATVTVSRYWGW